MYGLILIDPGDPAYSTAMIFEPDWVLPWINAAGEADFGDDNRTFVDPPDEAPSSEPVGITIGSPDNDAAHAATAWLDELTGVHTPTLDDIGFDDEDYEDDDCDGIYTRRVKAWAQANHLDVTEWYEGLWY